MSTIKDVAKLAGVSPSTVSRTLSNRIFVEEETRRKVLKAVEELNYHPSIMAKGLKEGKTYSIGFMVPDINSLFYPMVMKAVEKCAADKGYSLILMNNDESIEKEQQALNSIASRGLDGVICMSVEDEVTHLELFQSERRIPVVLINRNVSDQMSSVSIDDEHGGYVMTKYLLDQGHTRIAGVFGSFEKLRFRARYNGCKKAMEEYGIKDFQKYFLYNVDSIEEAYYRTKELLSGEDRPTAIFAAMDILAIGIYSGISNSGLKIPEDISVVGFDNILMSQYMLPPLTTYQTPVAEIAAKSVELLMKQMDEPDCVRECAVRQGTLMERKSVKRI